MREGVCLRFVLDSNFLRISELRKSRLRFRQPEIESVVVVVVVVVVVKALKKELNEFRNQWGFLYLLIA